MLQQVHKRKKPVEDEDDDDELNDERARQPRLPTHLQRGASSAAVPSVPPPPSSSSMSVIVSLVVLWLAALLLGLYLLSAVDYEAFPFYSLPPSMAAPPLPPPPPVPGSSLPLSSTTTWWRRWRPSAEIAGSSADPEAAVPSAGARWSWQRGSLARRSECGAMIEPLPLLPPLHRDAHPLPCAHPNERRFSRLVSAPPHLLLETSCSISPDSLPPGLGGLNHTNANLREAGARAGGGGGAGGGAGAGEWNTAPASSGSASSSFSVAMVPMSRLGADLTQLPYVSLTSAMLPWRFPDSCVPPALERHRPDGDDAPLLFLRRDGSMADSSSSDVEPSTAAAAAAAEWQVAVRCAAAKHDVVALVARCCPPVRRDTPLWRLAASWLFSQDAKCYYNVHFVSPPHEPEPLDRSAAQAPRNSPLPLPLLPPSSPQKYPPDPLQNVLLVHLGQMSRLSFERSFPKTHAMMTPQRPVRATGLSTMPFANGIATPRAAAASHPLPSHHVTELTGLFETHGTGLKPTVRYISSTAAILAPLLEPHSSPASSAPSSHSQQRSLYRAFAAAGFEPTILLADSYDIAPDVDADADMRSLIFFMHNVFPRCAPATVLLEYAFRLLHSPQWQASKHFAVMQVSHLLDLPESSIAYVDETLAQLIRDAPSNAVVVLVSDAEMSFEKVVLPGVVAFFAPTTPIGLEPSAAATAAQAQRAPSPSSSPLDGKALESSNSTAKPSLTPQSLATLLDLGTRLFPFRYGADPLNGAAVHRAMLHLIRSGKVERKQHAAQSVLDRATALVSTTPASTKHKHSRSAKSPFAMQWAPLVPRTAKVPKFDYSPLWRRMVEHSVNMINSLSHPGGSLSGVACSFVELDKILTPEPLVLGAPYLYHRRDLESSHPTTSVRFAFSVVSTSEAASSVELLDPSLASGDLAAASTTTATTTITTTTTATATSSEIAPGTTVFEATFREVTAPRGTFPELRRLAVGLAWDTCGINGAPIQIVAQDHLEYLQASHLWAILPTPVDGAVPRSNGAVPMRARGFDITVEWVAPNGDVVQNTRQHISASSPNHVTPLTAETLSRVPEYKLAGEWTVRVSKVGNLAAFSQYSFWVQNDLSRLEPDTFTRYWRLSGISRISPYSYCSPASVSPVFCVC